MQTEQLNELKSIPLESLLSITLSAATDKSARLDGKTIILKSRVMQFETIQNNKAFHTNVEFDKLIEYIADKMQIYRQLTARCEGKTYEFKLTSKGKLLSNVTKNNLTKGLSVHNKEKNYLVSVCPPLIDLGIMTADGTIKAAMYDKFKQIDRFVTIVDEAIKEFKYQHISILDFGCGKSYLTFIMYYYLTKIKKMSVEIVGLDLKADVIENCNKLVEKYGYSGIQFKVGDINGFKFDRRIDMVISLHACDTATDYALFNAVKAKADIILSAPCCQHEINSQLKVNNILTNYGIIKERTAALLTDGIRANLLNYCGYKTQVLEFVDFTHSPKNIMLRAVRRGEKNRKALAEVEQTLKEWGIKQTLYELITSKQ